jgi:hypothetical protein
MIFCFPKNLISNSPKTAHFHFGKRFGEKGVKQQSVPYKEVLQVRKKNFKGRCEKRIITKCSEVCRTYDAIQYAYADILQASDEVKEIRCNVPLNGRDISEYTSDFVCVKSDNDLMVRECVFRKFLMKPLTVKLLDASREYWLRHGVTDWGLVIDEET